MSGQHIFASQITKPRFLLLSLGEGADCHVEALQSSKRHATPEQRLRPCRGELLTFGSILQGGTEVPGGGVRSTSVGEQCLRKLGVCQLEGLRVQGDGFSEILTAEGLARTHADML